MIPVVKSTFHTSYIKDFVDISSSAVFSWSKTLLPCISLICIFAITYRNVVIETESKIT